MHWRHHHENPSGRENAFDFAASQWQIIDKLEHADRNYNLEKSVFIWHLRCRPAHKAGVNSVLCQNLGNLIAERMRVNAIKLIGVPRQLGEEYATTITDFQQPLGMGSLKHRPDQIKSKSLNAAEDRAVIPVPMVNRAGSQKRMFRQQTQVTVLVPKPIA